MEEEGSEAEVVASMVYGTPHYLPQYVVSPFVARQYSICNRKRGGAGMVGDYAERKL
jgi:hypothetical protein